MNFPNYILYEKLYARFFKRGIKEYLDFANVLPCHNVLDLCGGNGRLTFELLKKSEHVSYLDQEKDMIPDTLQSSGATVYNMSVNDFLNHTEKKFDRVFCIQAINYWLLDAEVLKLANIFNKGGVFIFNTFNTPPPTLPSIKNYVLDGINYTEISYLENDNVQHIQIREGFAPHVSTFKYISRELFVQKLQPFFDIKIITDNKTDIYVCTKK